MDFNLVQSYILKLPELDDIKKTLEVKDIISKYSEKVVDEYLNKLIDKRHKEIVSAVNPEELENMDFSFDYYIKILKKELITEKGRPLKKVINAMGTIYSDYIGNRLYTEEVLDNFAMVFSKYTNLELDEEKSQRVEIADEINKLLQCKIKNKDFLLFNNMSGAIHLLTDSFFKEKDIIAGFSDNYYFEEGLGLYDIIEKSGGKLKTVGFSNRIKIEDYLKEIKTKEELILYSDFIENRIYDTPKISFDEVSRMKNIAKTLYIGDGVYFETDSEEVKNMGESVSEILEKDFEYYILSMSKIGGLADLALLVSSKENILRLKNNPLRSILKPKKESEVLFYFGLKSLAEGKMKTSYLNSCFEFKEEDIQSKNRRFVRNIEREAGEELEINIIKGNYLSLNQSLNKNLSFERELIYIRPLNIGVEELESELRNSEPAVYCWLNDGGIIINLQLVNEQDEDIIADIIVKKVKRL